MCDLFISAYCGAVANQYELAVGMLASLERYPRQCPRNRNWLAHRFMSQPSKVEDVVRLLMI